MSSDSSELDRLLELFCYVELSDDEVDAELRSAGHDPEQVGRHYERLVDEMIRTSPYNWRQTARRDRQGALAELQENRSRAPVLERGEILARIRQLLGQSHAMAFRNYEDATDDDLRSTLEELEYLGRGDE